MYRWELKLSLEFVCSILCTCIHSHAIFIPVHELCCLPWTYPSWWFNCNKSEILIFMWSHHNGLCIMLMFCMLTSDAHCFLNHCSILFLHVPSHEQHNKVYLYQVFKDLILLEFIIWLLIVSICVKKIALIFLWHVSV